MEHGECSAENMRCKYNHFKYKKYLNLKTTKIRKYNAYYKYEIMNIIISIISFFLVLFAEYVEKLVLVCPLVVVPTFTFSMNLHMSMMLYWHIHACIRP